MFEIIIFLLVFKNEVNSFLLVLVVDRWVDR